MTTQDRLTIEPAPVPALEQINTSIVDAELNTAMSDTEAGLDFISQDEAMDLFAGLDDVDFNQSELQSLRSILRAELNALNTQIAELQKLQKFFYRTADKMRENEPHIAKAFECLNVTRTALRQSKARLRKLETMQRKARLLTQFVL
jgi:hypothetical protein